MLRAGLRALGGAALLHTAASGASILHAAMGERECWNDNILPPPSASWQPSARDAHVESVVSRMYAGAGLDGSLCSDGVTFEDPAAACCGRAEVVEAFRALRACKPQHVTAPQLCYSAPRTTVLLLHQRYFGRGEGGLVVRSELHVGLDDAGVICSFEERWNGKRLLGDGVGALWPVRRINGIVSFCVTPTAVV